MLCASREKWPRGQLPCETPSFLGRLSPCCCWKIKKKTGKKASCGNKPSGRPSLFLVLNCSSLNLSPRSSVVAKCRLLSLAAAWPGGSRWAAALLLVGSGLEIRPAFALGLTLRKVRALLWVLGAVCFGVHLSLVPRGGLLGPSQLPSAVFEH